MNEFWTYAIKLFGVWLIAVGAYVTEIMSDGLAEQAFIVLLLVAIVVALAREYKTVTATHREDHAILLEKVLTAMDKNTEVLTKLIEKMDK